jgi:cytochrome c5
MNFRRFAIGFAGLLAVFTLAGCGKEPEPGTVKDEALAHGRTAASFPAATEDYFADMDGGYKRATDPTVVLDKNEVIGRNNWIVWTGGNDRFWDYMANNTFGAFDLLKILSSNPHVGFCIGPDHKLNDKSEYASLSEKDCKDKHFTWYAPARSNRFDWYGLVNEPCFTQATKPDKYGLWLDVRNGKGPGCDKPDPYADETKYPGVKFGARGKNMPVGSFYGEPSGIVGLRLFPNPDFDEAAEKKWNAAIKDNPDAFYTDPEFYNNKHLVRPYRVGMSCGFCHVGPAPTNAPKDPENPQWANLNSNPGAQYFWVDRIFIWNPKDVKSNFIFQLFHTSQPGALDTSFVSTDNINNPRTMNAVYNVKARLLDAHWKEKIAGGALDNKQFGDYPQTQDLKGLFIPPDTVLTPRVLKDGSDSVGALGALNRVYLNIGLFSEEWLLHFNPLVGGKRITPIPIATNNKNSSYWNATQEQTPDLALFFLKTGRPDKLADTPEGKASPPDPTKLTRGKTVFAENCARCHSSKQPPNLCMLGQPCKAGQIIENTGEYFDWMRKEVMKPDFLDGNYLSTDRRVSIQEIGINACSPLATNAIRGDIWDNFSSETYKTLPAVGKIAVYDPVDGTPFEYDMPGGGRGYVRPPSLISLWSSAPYLQNNSIGIFNGDPSVKGRLAAFDDGITKMLWPEKRDKDPILGGQIPGPSKILRTTSRSYLKVPAGYLPGNLDMLADTWSGWLHHLAPWLFTASGDVQIGPIPKGTPVNLLANLNPLSESTRLEDRVAHTKKLIDLVIKLKRDLKSLPSNATDAQAAEVFKKRVPELLALNKCPDFIVNKGHYFGSNLADDDKQALIEFLKTL